MTDNSNAALADDLDAALRRSVDASRRRSQTRWRSASSSGGSSAAAVEALVAQLARLEHAIEVGSAEPPAHWRTPPTPPYPSALSDRLAVVGHGLVAAVRSAPSGLLVWQAGALVPLDGAVRAALDELAAVPDL